MGWYRAYPGLRGCVMGAADDFEEAWIHPREFYMTSEEGLVRL
ncbi:MAG: hypothetical protein CM1200mP21_02540 [Candidatus Poseidoniales archaeon]|nr:MAG: hypothetical protein CM1200mP21_02540 [Candidatus Poseidoniales archaeon]